ncbi:MAG TPA: BACON domain-containing protein, partial [Vicinamibacterales bacterium]|nr:BACON domain-containing protein [Vicinamibacterales bacterium]
MHAPDNVSRPFPALPAALSVLVAACESSSVSTVVSPSAPAKCAIAIEHQTPSFPAAGGNGTIRVVAARECAWSASSEVSWITIASGREGQGAGSVAYTVAPNDVAAARRGALVVGDQRAEIAQEAAPCRFDLQPATATVGHEGGDQFVDVRATKGCDWEARSEAAWIAIVAGGRGSGDGRLHLRAPPNSGPARTGTVAVADRRFQWQQAGARGGGPDVSP